MIAPRVLLAAFASLLFATASLAQVEASLASADAAVRPGEPITVALRLDHEDHWHSYWVNAGTGYPTSIEWDLPEGWTAGEIQWPTPVIIRDSHGTITGNGYEHVTYLPVTLTPPADLAPGTEVTLQGHADWLMCADVCIPGDQAIALTLPVVAPDTPRQPHAAHGAEVRDVLAALPAAPGDLQISATKTGTSATLTVSGLSSEPATPWFFASDAFIQYDLPQSATYADGTLTVTLPVSEFYDGDGDRLVGVLRQDGSWTSGQNLPGIAIDAVFGAAPIGMVAGPAATDAPATSSVNLLGTLALAFIGGLILNLMPCVFPVLGIKILGFVNQAGSDRRKVALHGWVFTLGVLASFWSLAGLLAVLRAGGDNLGWGFQLQSAPFVFVLAAVMLIFAMAMSGVFEFGLSATGVGAKLQSKDGLTGTFFTGVLATVVATPCSAPFLAPALGAALAVPIVASFAIFTAIAIGLSMPYLLLSLFPSAIKILPRPGAWMETFKQAMAFPLYATVGYLVWVLAGQTTEGGALNAIFGLTLIAFGVWFYGRYAAAGNKPARRRFGIIAGLVVLGTGALFGWPKPPAPNDIVWEKWSPEAIAAARAEGRPVYVDFTARWCATCQANKKLVFSSDDVKETFRDQNVLTLKADWTNKDPAITAELAKWNRSAVPFNLVYLPGESDPTILPELLTPSTVLEALN
ncbi:protein-disulfide reductase DsbD family protein [Synoicihabitans lomoniglobus]|uniref:Thioredoxin family protein n=1 Tax=Synoicihabitans lomoniglobus TaxID=2909285 RepID=A0AAF0CNE2_9BACT|nr:thioredoxin family protein [Opitutaceae bacterium LMO-M01]WED64325.1 thioredoxin family protein [Opitutaceae bacterium LMO-M01]